MESNVEREPRGCICYRSLQSMVCFCTFSPPDVSINVPWWYLAFNKMINLFFTERTKGKFVFACLSKSAETLFKYIAFERVPVQYGGVSREGEPEFTSSNLVTKEIINLATKHTIEFPALKCPMVELG